MAKITEARFAAGPWQPISDMNKAAMDSWRKVRVDAMTLLVSDDATHFALINPVPAPKEEADGR